MLLFNNTENISLGIQFYYEKKKEVATFLEDKKILNAILKLYIQTYIPKSIIKVLLLYNKK